MIEGLWIIEKSNNVLVFQVQSETGILQLLAFYNDNTFYCNTLCDDMFHVWSIDSNNKFTHDVAERRGWTTCDETNVYIDTYVANWLLEQTILG